MGSLSRQIRAAYTFIPFSVSVTPSTKKNGKPVVEYGPPIAVLVYGGPTVEEIMEWEKRADDLEDRIRELESFR